MKFRSDTELGMQQKISRRDFLNGASVAIGATLLPGSSPLWANTEQDSSLYYPPSLTGMRGNHAGSFEIAHGLRDGNQWEATDKGENYDLIVIGAGISGLSAAHYYRKSAGNNARILILDNHDDFGGHAKRNEFDLDGRTFIGYGGTESLESPGSYPQIASDLIKELGIDTQRFYTAFDRELYNSFNLKRATFFNRETFGVDHLAVGNIQDPDVLQAIPLSDEGKADLVRLLANDQNYLPGMSPAERLGLLKKIDYLTYLKDYAGLNTEVLKYADSLTRNTWAMGADGLPAAVAWSGGSPGFADMDLGFKAYQAAGAEPWIFHFPDGNATVSRLLVRRMIPAVAAGVDMEDILTDTFDYSRLDESDSPVRIRLNSTVVRAKHQGKDQSGPVDVTYVNAGKAHRVKAEKVAMAGFHAMAPMLCPEIPEPQRNALSNAQRAPMVFTNVLIRNWTSFNKLGLKFAYCPGSYHNSMALDFPVSMGSYTCPKTPEEPMILHLVRTPGQAGLSAYEQFKAGKRDLLTTPFETFERNIRDQLGRVLGPGGFDPARDIAGITVNRWPHGYAYGHDPESGDIAFEPQLWPEAKKHWQRGRQRFGNISFAGIDSSSNAMTESAIEEAHRAIEDLKPL